jgi:hypothetical protein
MIAIVCGAVPARRVEASSLKVVSRTQWVLFSMAPQWSRSSWARSGALALFVVRLVWRRHGAGGPRPSRRR